MTPTFHRTRVWLTKHKALTVHPCMEATGTYGEGLATHLHQTGHRVSVLNPAIIKAFAITEMSRTKTDKSDTTLIARYCDKHHPPGWAPLAPEISELQALVRRLEGLLEMSNRNATGFRQASTLPCSKRISRSTSIISTSRFVILRSSSGITLISILSASSPQRVTRPADLDSWYR